MKWTKELWNEACCHHDSEEWLVYAIKKHLLSKTDKAMMEKYDLSIEDMLNGRVEGKQNQITVQYIFDSWNTILGWKEFC